MTARSFGARLEVSDADADRLSALVSTVGAGVALRSLAEGDVDAVLRLDAATLGDYPGSLATRHDPLDRERATRHVRAGRSAPSTRQGCCSR